MLLHMLIEKLAEIYCISWYVHSSLSFKLIFVTDVSSYCEEWKIEL